MAISAFSQMSTAALHLPREQLDFSRQVGDRNEARLES